MMSRWRAPSALRTPISRVRSVTLTSMIFITPMPPTSRPRAEMAIETIRIIPVILSKFWMIESAVEMLKSSSSPAGVLRSFRNAHADLFDRVGAHAGFRFRGQKEEVRLGIAHARRLRAES